MAGQYGAMQPFVDHLKRANDAFTEMVDRIPDLRKLGRKVDTSYQDRMVREANEGFRKRAEAESKRRKASSSSGQARSASTKPAARKTLARKVGY